MTGEPRPGGPEILELSSVPGFVVFDLPGAAESAGGTRLAPDVSVAEVALLARAMTYKFAALGAQRGGAKAGVRGDPSDRPAISRCQITSRGKKTTKRWIHVGTFAERNPARSAFFLSRRGDRALRGLPAHSESIMLT